MRTRTYKLTSTGTADASVNVQVARKGTIVGWQACGFIDCTADGASLEAELAHNQATSQIATNDGLGVVGEMSICSNLVTSGLDQSGMAASMAGIAIPVEPGDKLYLHTDFSGSISNSRVTFLVYVAE